MTWNPTIQTRSTSMAGYCRRLSDSRKSSIPWRKMVAERPNDPHALFLLGMVDYDEGNDAEAQQQFTRSLQLDPKNNDTRYYLAMLDERDGNFDEARKGLEEVLKTDPNHAGAQH